MNEPQYLLTHFYRRTPTPQGWIETVFITRPKGQETYYLTFLNRPVRIEKINNDVDNGSLVELPVEYEIRKEQSVWIAPDQAIYIADGRKPRSSNPVQIFQDDILSVYDAIDLAVQNNLEQLTSSLEVYFGPSTWKILLSVVIKYINNETIGEFSFANVSYIFPKLEAKYGDQFREFLKDNLMNYSIAMLHFRNRQGMFEKWDISVIDEEYKQYLTNSNLLLFMF